MLQDAEALRLWIRPEVLELGVLPVIIPEKISLEVSQQISFLGFSNASNNSID